MNNLQATQLESNGYFILEKYFTEQETTPLEDALYAVHAFDYESDNNAGNLLRTCSQVASLALSEKIKTLLPELPGAHFFPVKAFVLDKNKVYNWIIPWHQDLKIAVQEMIPTEGYQNWTLEADIPHVHPPLSVLEGMVTVRIHLDDCTAYNGAMQVISGSHLLGLLDKDAIDHLVLENTAITCAAGRGSVMVFKPLLLHCSPYSEAIQSRRVLQLEYATADSLAEGLGWH